MICPYCGHEHPDSITFCPTTGQKLTADLCPKCGTEIQSSWKICPKCGVPVSHSAQLYPSGDLQSQKSGQLHTPSRLWIPTVFLVLVLTVIAYFMFPRLHGAIDSPVPQVSREISSSEGGELAQFDGAVVRIPPDGLHKNTLVSIERATLESVPQQPPELISVGNPYKIDVGSEQLGKPITLEIPFDPASLPNDLKARQVFLSYYDENKEEWVYAGGKVDISRNVIILETTHASWWMPTTWNWDAWIAVLNKTLQVGIVNWIEAARLLTDDCPQTGSYVQVDSSQTRNIVQGCIEQDEAERPGLRIVNPKSFFFEVRPVSGGNGYPAQTLLSPGEDLRFEASTSDLAPLVIEANMTQKSGWYLVVHMILTMLPGANQFGIQGQHVACITERLADVSYFADVVEVLVVEQDGVAAAERLSEFMLDDDAVRRFISAADDCNFGPAPTWSVEGIRQIGGAVSTILSATDYIANYFANNTTAQVSFVWNYAETVANTCDVVFVASWQGDGVYVLDPSKGDISDQSQTSLFNNFYLAWNETRDELYVAADNGGVISVMKMQPLREIATISADVGWNAYSIAVSPDGNAIYVTFSTGGESENNRRLVVLNPNTRTSSHVITLANTWGSAYLALSPDGQQLYVSWDSQLDIYDTSDMALIERVINVTTSSGRLAVSNDGHYLFLVQPNQLIKFEISTRSIVGTLHWERPVNSIAWIELSHDGNTIWVSGSDRIYEVPTSLETPAVIQTARPISLAESTDGSVLFVSSEENGTVSAIDLMTGDTINSYQVPHAIDMLVRPCN